MKINNFISLVLVFLYSCSSSYKIKDGKEAFDLKQYHVAIDLLKKELEETKRNDERIQKMFFIGRCFNELLDYNQALEWYGMAERNNYGAIATLQKAYVLKNLMRYNEAIENFESLKSITSLTQEVSRQALVCNSLKLQREASNKNISIEEVFEEALYSDYAPTIYDSDFLVFTSDRDESTGNDKYKWTGKKYSDLYIADKESKSVQRFDAVINTNNNEGTPAFNTNFTMCVFSRCYDINEEKNQYCKLLYSNRIDGIWAEPTELPFIKPDINYGHPCFFEKDSILIFSATGENQSQGFDLWYSEFGGTTWSEALPLPNTINTTFNEHFPTADKDTLYFSSDNSNGFGGLDIYKTWVNKDGSWVKPIHLEFPYNSGADDFSFVVDRYSPITRNVLKQGYFSSSRSNEGHDNLYQFKVFDNIDDKIIEKPKQNEGLENKDIYLALKVLVANTSLNNKRRISLSRAKVSLQDSNFLTDKNGLILHQLKSDTDYSIKIEKDSFLSKSIIVSTKDITFNEGENIITINKEVELEKIERGKEIMLENIYYEYDQWNIREDAKPSLDKLAVLLKENPNIYIELGSHTDCRGVDEYNLDLSRKRAESVVNYLLNKGIFSTRMIAKGYGETVPSFSCVCEDCTEEMHQQNRRTSFKIL